MSFLTANIDRAIVMTQFDLRGFGSALGFRYPYKSSAKRLAFTASNFMGYAAGNGQAGGPTDKGFVDGSSTYEEYLAMCQRLAKVCDGSQHEAIQLIILEIVRQSNEFKAEVVAGKREENPYLIPIDKDNYWGKVVLALVEAFDVRFDPVALAA